MIRLGADTGGTFTDLVLYDEATRTFQVHKVLSTPDDPSRAVLSGISELLEMSRHPYSVVRHVIHGTTVASNVVLERKGEPTALITTRGFRDVLIIGREKRHHLFDLQIEKPRPLILRRASWEVTERIAADGREITPLDMANVEKIAQRIADNGIVSVAIAFINAYANPSHEQQLARALSEMCPGLYLSLSSDVAPQWREYERFNTTAANAYTMPAMTAYLQRLESALRDAHVSRPLFIMQSNGGIVTAETAARYPVRAVESGPAAGALAAAWFGRNAGIENMLSFDMGGTTAKVCLIRQGTPQVRDIFEIDQVALRPRSGLPLNIPSIDLLEIGAGGGSIARRNLGLIDVGPDSAGAAPGPICYDRGGTEPTVTDANLILGYLDPDFFLGGEFALNQDAAWRGVEEQLGTPLDISVPDAAWAIHSVATNKMASAARAATINRGVDPRNLTMIAFGGAGPLHACHLARALEISEVLVPPFAGVASAIGLLTADFRFDFAMTFRVLLAPESVPTISRIFDTLESRGRQLLSESVDEDESQHAQFLRWVDLRYVGQGYELTLPISGGEISPATLEALISEFHQYYEAEYGFSEPGEPVEVVNWRLTALIASPSDRIIISTTSDSSNLQDAIKGQRPAYSAEVRGFIPYTVYDRYKLPSHVPFTGPAIIEEVESTIIIPTGSSVWVDDHGNVRVKLNA